MTKNEAIFTIGHSTHSAIEFIKILKAFDVEMLIDVRHYPGSRYCPQFGKDRLKRSLKRNGIGYHHIVGLGGRRRSDKQLHINDGWRSSQFRGYADHMQTKEFKDGLRELITIAREKIVVIMCSEAVPWRCHRSMIADALIANNFIVIDIFSEQMARFHSMTLFAKINGKKITYPAEV